MLSNGGEGVTDQTETAYTPTYANTPQKLHTNHRRVKRQKQ